MFAIFDMIVCLLGVSLIFTLILLLAISTYECRHAACFRAPCHARCLICHTVARYVGLLRYMLPPYAMPRHDMLMATPLPARHTMPLRYAASKAAATSP